MDRDKEEVWKDIDRFEGVFQVSNLGNVRNLETGNLITGRKKDKEGNIILRLSLKGKRYTIRMAKVLADAFIPNPNNYKYSVVIDKEKPTTLDNIMWTDNTKILYKLEKGHKVNFLTVIEDLGMDYSSKYPKHNVICSCECGTVKEYPYTVLNTGKIKSCGCYKPPQKPKKKYNIEKLNKNVQDAGLCYKIHSEIDVSRVFNISCEKCGVEKTLNRETIRDNIKNNKNCCNRKYPQELITNLKRRLVNIKQRCYDQNCKDYKNYGARGITVCDEWLEDSDKFVDWSFENGYEYTLEIDRENNDKGYSPDNCRWVERIVNIRNQSTVKLDLEKAEIIRNSDKSIKELAEEFGVCEGTISAVKKGRTWM